MANNNEQLRSLFTDIADSIRSKTGETGAIYAANFPEAIDAIEVSGGSTTAVTDDGYGNIELNELYSFNFTDDGNGNLICEIVPGTSSTDNSGDITII